MKRSFIVVGCGRFGYSVATRLFEMGYDVMAIDNDEETVQDLSDKVTYSVQADATDATALSELGVQNFDVAVISIASDVQSSILATILVKEMGVNYVVCKAKDNLQAKVLYKIGADKVVFPEKDMGIKVANSLVSKNVVDYFDIDSDYAIAEIKLPSSYFDKKIKDIPLRQTYDLNIVGIKDEEGIRFNPDAKKVLKEGEVLIVIGTRDMIQKFEEIE